MKASLPPLHPVVNLIIRSDFDPSATYCIWRFLLFIFWQKKAPLGGGAISIKSFEVLKISYYNRDTNLNHTTIT